MLGSVASHKALLDEGGAVGKRDKRPIKSEDLKRTTEEFITRFSDYLLAGNRLELLLADTKLRDVIVSWGILIDKFQLLSGQPTQIIGAQEHKKMDELGNALLAEMTRRQQAKALAAQTEITVSK